MLTRFAICLTLMAVVPGISRAEEGANLTIPSATPNLSSITYKQVARERTFSRAWKISLAPLLASQALDASSSYGLRELNPALANANGQFGMRSTAIKFAATGALIGVEYLVIRKHPRAASAFAKLNWATSIVTAGFAAHNYAIR
ncbi:MAG: hypothetical protein ABI823_01170 [Bryobacteraceae bacterium]